MSHCFIDTTENQLFVLDLLNYIIICIFQAFWFKLPNLLWQELNEATGAQIEKMVALVKDSSFDNAGHKKFVFDSVAEFIERWLIINRKPFWFMKSYVGMKTKKVCLMYFIFLYACIVDPLVNRTTVPGLHIPRQVVSIIS